MGAVSSFRDLKVWRLGVEISLAVYRVTTNFPDHERFGLTAQLRRAAVSIPSNVAEGNARESTKDYLRHLSIASGSLAEIETQLLIATELGFIDTGDYDDLISLCEEESRMLRSLQHALRKRLP
ncbi:four helix bundle protein [Botrimarina sp.]|uniref:four helix bundle protein n=1 Tax=Botrimarina sp. TaxID=2795802 RepID=UPI0032EE91DC